MFVIRLTAHLMQERDLHKREDFLSLHTFLLISYTVEL